MRAFNKSIESNHPIFPMGAILAQGNRIISYGTNKHGCTHPKQKVRTNSLGMEYGRHFPHAELICLLAAPKNKRIGSTIYVARRLNKGGTGMAKPCQHCHTYLLNEGVKKVVYTVKSEDFTNWYNDYYL